MNVKALVVEVAKECGKKECRLSLLGSSSTCMSWAPVHDRHGNVLDSDPNTITHSLNCSVCGRWAVKQVGDERTISRG